MGGPDLSRSLMVCHVCKISAAGDNSMYRMQNYLQFLAHFSNFRAQNFDSPDFRTSTRTQNNLNWPCF